MNILLGVSLLESFVVDARTPPSLSILSTSWIYIYRERERDTLLHEYIAGRLSSGILRRRRAARRRHSQYPVRLGYIYIYIYIYIYKYIYIYIYIYI